jgi:nucleotide-binding universal stress UspA family protein
MGRQAGVSEAPDPIRRILVAVDGSEPAAHALQWAIAMARGMGAEVIAVFAIAPFQDLSRHRRAFGPTPGRPGWRAACTIQHARHAHARPDSRTDDEERPPLAAFNAPFKAAPATGQRAQHFRVRTDRVDV